MSNSAAPWMKRAPRRERRLTCNCAMGLSNRNPSGRDRKRSPSNGTPQGRAKLETHAGAAMNPAEPNQNAAWRDLTPLMAPRSVGISGASQRSPSPLSREPRGNRVIRNLKQFGYTGRIVAVNPKYTEIMDCPCYPEIAAIPEPVDCVVVAVPNRHV